MKPIVFLIHEIYGITDNLKKLSSLLTSKGFYVIMPSLYLDGYVGTDEKYSYQKFFSEVGFEASKQIINSIVEENAKDKIILIGFSIGATVAWLQSENPNIHSIIGFYGSRIRNYLDVNPLRDSSLFFCNEDGFDVEELIMKLNAKENVTARSLLGNHGFYSNLQFNSSEINEANRLILDLLRKE
jgi:dienelactone hydrolase